MDKGQARDLFTAKAAGLITEQELLAEWARMGYTLLVDVDSGAVIARVGR